MEFTVEVKLKVFLCGCNVVGVERNKVSGVCVSAEGFGRFGQGVDLMLSVTIFIVQGEWVLFGKTKGYFDITRGALEEFIWVDNALGITGAGEEG